VVRQRKDSEATDIAAKNAKSFWQPRKKNSTQKMIDQQKVTAALTKSTNETR